MTDFISQTTKQIKGRSKPCLYRRTGPQETKNYWLLRNLQWPKTGIYRTLYLIIQLFKHFFFYEKHWKKFVNINLSLYIRQLLQIITENRGIIIAFFVFKKSYNSAYYFAWHHKKYLSQTSHSELCNRSVPFLLIFFRVKRAIILIWLSI